LRRRARLIGRLSEIVGRDLFPLADANFWLPQFRDKLSQIWQIDTATEGGFNARPQP
jgi:hypothetical protein